VGLTSISDFLSLISGAVLGIGTITLRQTETWETRGLFTEQAIKLAITAWPIIFAAILAQSLKAFATYRVERGIRLMVSDGSQSLECKISTNA
jgi:hypothetical protein